MREILFRGKSRISRTWVVGDFLHEFIDWGAVIKSSSTGYHAIDPSTVGQFTGLQDKNGKRIFEGDIVEGDEFNPDNDGYGVIGWDDGAFTVSNEYTIGTFHENFYGAEFTVIGNIHDDPDLLEVK